jgi:hypothetical protein
VTNGALAARLRMIDVLLQHYGHFNRKALMDCFGLSQPQVSLDIARYAELAPGNAEYDASARRYRRSETFRRRWP